MQNSCLDLLCRVQRPEIVSKIMAVVWRMNALAKFEVKDLEILLHKDSY